MSGAGQPKQKPHRTGAITKLRACLLLAALGACQKSASEKARDLADAARPRAAASTTATPAPLPLAGYIPTPLGTPAVGTTAQGPEKVDFQDVAMGTNVHMIAYTNPQVDAEHIKLAINNALLEMRRLEGLMSEWHDDSEVGRINANPEQWVNVGPETFAVISRALDESKASDGAFDITFQAMSNIWKFGTAAEAQPKLPNPAEIAQRRKLVDYRTVELDPKMLAG